MRDAFMARAYLLNRNFVVKEVAEYIGSIWQDSPAYKEGGAVKRPNPWCYEAWIIDQLAARYGWAIEYILALPLAQIRTLQNIIHAELCAKAGEKPDFTAPPSVHLQSEWLARHNQLNTTSTATEGQ